MAGQLTDSEGARRRLDQALDVLRQALVRYMSTLPRASRSAYGRLDLPALVQAFIDRFVELSLPRRARTLAFAAREARNEIAHFTGTMTRDDALRHLSNVRQLLKDLAVDAAFEEVDRLYNEQLQAFGGGESPRATDTREKVASAADSSKAPVSGPGKDAVRGKYRALYDHLSGLHANDWAVTFRDIEAVLETPLPRSARSHPAWWSNTTSHSHAKAWLAAGWRTADLNLTRERVSFVRSRGGVQSYGA